MNKRNRFDALIYALLPLPFVATGFLNMLYFVLFQERFDLLRKLFVFGTEGIVALLLLWKCFLLWRQRPELRRLTLAVCCLPLLLGGLFGLALLFRSMSFLIDAIVNCCTLVSCCCVVLILWAEKTPARFFRTVRVYACIAAPIALFYCIRFYLPTAAYGVEKLGVIDYMTLAYILLHLLILLVMGRLFCPAQTDAHKYRYLDTALFLLFSIAITLSGTKGTMLCLLFGTCVAALFAPAHHISKKQAAFYPAAAFLSVLLFTTVLYPDYGVENRVLAFLKEGNSVEVNLDQMQAVSKDIQAAQTPPADSTSPSASEQPADSTPDATPSTPEQPSTDTTSPDDTSAGEQVDISGIGDVVSYVLDGDAQRDYLAGRLSEESYQAMQEMARKLNNTSTGARKYLWTCAFREIRSAPLTGHGILSFQAKYGTYPHNFFLEVATDFGLPLMLGVLLLGLWVFLKLIRASFRNPLVAAFTFYVLTFLPQRMITGSIYNSSVFFEYGFCILLACFLSRSEKAKETQCDPSIALQ